MRLFVAEDEAPARERLLECIATVAPQAVVVGSAASVRDTRAWLAAHDAPDLLLLDIQLADGLSLELFADGALALPTVFTTAYDEFALAAFRALAIDYLLKPVAPPALARAFERVDALRERFGAQEALQLRARLQDPRPATPRRRWLARQGSGFVAVPVEQVAFFVSVDKLTFVVTRDGVRRAIDETLAEVERDCDPRAFFRISRQVVVAAAAVARFAPGGKGRLVVEIDAGRPEQAAVSQERAAAFRQWLAQ